MDGKRFVLRRIKYSFCHVHSPARKSLNPATYELNTLHKTVNNGILIRPENLRVRVNSDHALNRDEGGKQHTENPRCNLVLTASVEA